MQSLKELKVGDKVFIYGRFSKTLGTISKITPKGFIKVKDVLYNPDTGLARGSDTWCTVSIAPASEEEVEKYIKEEFIYKVISKMHDIKSLSYQQALKIGEILDGDTDD